MKFSFVPPTCSHAPQTDIFFYDNSFVYKCVGWDPRTYNISSLRAGSECPADTTANPVYFHIAKEVVECRDSLLLQRFRFAFGKALHSCVPRDNLIHVGCKIDFELRGRDGSFLKNESTFTGAAPV
eukprot:1325435-Amorphochlora_amoeboformis.AAC.1